MDGLLARVTQQAMNYAIRSGITLTASYALRQSTRLLRRREREVAGDSDADAAARAQLELLQERLEGKIRIVAPAIDLIELISARGNTSLGTAVRLTQSLRWSIQSLGQRLAATSATDPLGPVVAELRRVLTRLEDAVPLLNLAITTSGATLSGTLPPGISPSRLLQASTFVTAGDSAYARSCSVSRDEITQQIGPTFTLSLYMLFTGHVRPETEDQIRNTTWKEVLHKARVKLLRVPLDSQYDIHETNHIRAKSRTDEFAYHMLIVEDLDDDRVHTYEDGSKPGPYGDVALAGIREPLPIHEIAKIFYADTGKILNIGDDVETNSPVLLLKRDINAVPPRRMMERDELEREWDFDGSLNGDTEAAPEKILPSKEQWRLPPDLDPEWLAFEVYEEDAESDSESEGDVFNHVPPSSRRKSHRASLGPDSPLTNAMSNLNLHTPSPRQGSDSPQPDARNQVLAPSSNTPQLTLPPIRTSLSLLETLLRLLSLQQFQQTSHLAIPDELLSFFLSEATSTTGAAAGDHAARRHLRDHARRRVGFDPYDESPIKRRGEEYLRYRGGKSQNGDRWLQDHNDTDTENMAGSGYVLDQQAHVFSSSPPPQLPSQLPPQLQTERRTMHRFASEPAPTPPTLKQDTKSRGKVNVKAASVSPTVEDRGSAEKAEETPEPEQLASSPIVSAQTRQLRSMNRAREGSPLASVESAGDE